MGLFKYLAEFDNKKSIKKLGVECLSLKMNLSDKKNIANVFKKAVEKFGCLDAVICNAGIAEAEFLLIDKEFEEISNIIDINLKGTIYCNKEACKYMLNQKKGVIVNISSILGKVGCACEVAYSASKAGIIGLTKALAKEMGGFGIRVNAIAPGVIKTNMTACFTAEELEQLRQSTELKRIGKPEDISSVVSFLVSDDSSFITGECIEVSGGLLI